MLVVANGTVLDDVQRSQAAMEFLSVLGAEHDMDVVVQNITETKALEDRYKGVKLFSSAEAAQDFVDIIDHNRKLVCSASLLTRIIFFVKGNRGDWKDIRKNLELAAFSPQAKAFKEVGIAGRDEVVDILGRDINGTLDLDAMLQRKYTTGEYFGSKVTGYDSGGEGRPTTPRLTAMQFMQQDKE
jgi:hypothetical protein